MTRARTKRVRDPQAVQMPGASAAFFRALVENSSDIVSVLDDQGVLLYATPAFERVLGHPRQEWIGKNIFELVHPADIPAVRAAFVQVVQGTNERVPTEFRARHANGAWIPVESLGNLSGGMAMAGGVVIATRDISDRKRYEQELIQAYDTTLEGWSRALDLRDTGTEGHTQRVVEMTLRLARAMGIGEDQLVHIRRGALLHDIGKLGIPDCILRKPGPLTAAELATMRQHPVYAYEMLRGIRYLALALDIPYCHHEKWDGTGYPRGLQGEVIPLAARIFAIVDVWDALRNDLPYRRLWSASKTLQYIRAERGKHFDPGVVAQFLKKIV